MIRVMQPYLPRMEAYTGYLDGAWERAWLTNDGPLVRRLESRLAEHWGVPHVVLVANGTLALELAARALDINGPVLTTPFSFLATPMAIQRAGLECRYADIERTYFNLDPELAQAQLATRAYGAVVPVHVYGNPVDPVLDDAARRAGARLLFDASHCAAAWHDGTALVARGDASAVSLHATKVLHAVEGGAVVTHDSEVCERVAALRNFGQGQGGEVIRNGTNAKMSEVHAAMGLAVLDDFDEIVDRRRNIAQRYERSLPSEIHMSWYGDAHPAAYQPIVLPDEVSVARVQEELNAKGVETRRYFHPSLDTVEVLTHPGEHSGAANSAELSSRILCLPFHTGLDDEDVDRISDAVVRALHG
jgi:dTDP-4-amino-4,6-dideoxygalactose transaminase